MNSEFTQENRNRLLSGRAAALAEYERLLNMAMATCPYTAEEEELLAKARAAMQQAESAEAEYFRFLPVLQVSDCPFCSKPLFRQFDPWGFDGPWWRSDASAQDPPACPHFFLLQGAVRLQGNERSQWEVYPGPTAPYVLPRLLEMPSVIAVVSELAMHNGCTARTIAYFAERRPKPEDRAAEWRRTSFVYTTQFGVGGWRPAEEKIDADLSSWAEKGKVRGMIDTGGSAPPEFSVITPAGVVKWRSV